MWTRTCGGTRVDGRKLKHWRLARTWTIRELAVRSGVNHAAISQLERGTRQPRPATIRKLADALDVEPMELLDVAPADFMRADAGGQGESGGDR